MVLVVLVVVSWVLGLYQAAGQFDAREVQEQQERQVDDPKRVDRYKEIVQDIGRGPAGATTPAASSSRYCAWIYVEPKLRYQTSKSSVDRAQAR